MYVYVQAPELLTIGRRYRAATVLNTGLSRALWNAARIRGSRKRSLGWHPHRGPNPSQWARRLEAWSLGDVTLSKVTASRHKRVVRPDRRRVARQTPANASSYSRPRLFVATDGGTNPSRSNAPACDIDTLEHIFLSDHQESSWWTRRIRWTVTRSSRCVTRSKIVRRGVYCTRLSGKFFV